MKMNITKAIVRTVFIGFIIIFNCRTIVWAQGKTDGTKPEERDYYRITPLPIPEGIQLEVGGVCLLPNGSIGVSTRRGEIWVVDNPYMLNNTAPYYHKFASGLHEVLGLIYKDGAFYCAQRGELTKLVDKDGDGKADIYETVYSWPLSGGYHEYSYGPVLLPNGNFMVTLNVMFPNENWWRSASLVPWRGWTLEITPDGKVMPYATGMRSPAGLGVIDGKFFFTENQGDWEASGGITALDKGDFTGDPAGLRWADRPESPVKVRLNDIYSLVDPRLGEKNKIEDNDSSRPYKTLFEVAAKVPGVKVPSVYIPHYIMGNSTSGFVEIPDDGKFGPYAGQILVGDQSQSLISRVFLEQVKGQYQGAAFFFRGGFESGVLRLCWGNDGSLFVGSTSRGWDSKGPKPFGLERVAWSGKVPFEMKAIRATPDGFEIEFTKPVNKTLAGDPDNYAIKNFTYKYHPVYGSDIIRVKNNNIDAAIVSADGLKVRLVVDSLREKYIHEITVNDNVLSGDNVPLLHPTAYYTLNNIPDGMKLIVPHRSPKRVANEHGMNMKMDMVPAKSIQLRKNQTTLPPSWNHVDQVVNIATLRGQLKYTKTELTVKAGSRIKLTFNNTDDMPHNFVVVQPGQAVAVGELGMKMGLEAVKQSYIPNTPKLLYNTTLVGPGASQTIYFVAPSVAGKYTYVCTVPGHFYIMQGTLNVEK
jgi:uncharacterized cupredoxin-like copper-binding protein